MSTHDQHTSFIKTPQQLIVVILLSFVVPVVGIVLLVKLVLSQPSADPGALTAEAVAARLQPVARVEIGAAAAPAGARKGEDIVLNMPGNVTFRTGSADLNAQFFKVLDGVAQVAKKYDKTIIEIAGHTDNVGGADFNRQLSQRRASAVAQYLMSKGVSEQRIITAAGGEDHPIASNSTDQGRAANRRVEVTLAPLKEG